jgi:hypothetical protein
MKKLIFIFVHHNNHLLIEPLISSIEKMEEINNFEIHIADSGSETDQLNRVKKLNRNFILHEYHNIGYFNCINLVLNKLKHQDCFFIIGNEDLQFTNKFYKNFIKNLPLYYNYEIICPSLITNDGINQNPHVLKSISKFRKVIYKLYYSNYFLAKIIMNLSKKSSLFRRTDTIFNDISCEIYMCHGSCFILTPKFSNLFNFILAPKFLCQEEAYLRKQLNIINGKIWYDCELLVHHMDSVSVKKIPSIEFWEISSTSYKQIKNIL